MLIGVAILLLLGLVFGPQLWARHTLKKYSGPRDDFPGTGGELAHHLLNRFELPEIKVEETSAGDHYDPGDKAVRLTGPIFSGKTLTAVVVAAHEVGHAIQDQTGYRPLSMRSRLVRVAARAEKLGAMLMVALPFIAILARIPAVGALILLAGLASLGIPVLIHLVTLPVEWDASFRRALPVLEAGQYISESDLPAARRILTACALTYLAASLASLLNFYTWIRILRR